MRTLRAALPYTPLLLVIGLLAWPSDRCLTTRAVEALTGGSRAGVMPMASDASQPEAEPVQTPDEAFTRTNRPGSVDLDAEYDLADLSIPREQIHTLLPRDAIPSLTDPALESVSEGADWLEPDDRVIDVTVLNESVAVPLRVLTYHEIANLTVAGRPVAATYCPLCDSVTLVSRELDIGTADEPETITLDFGVSGALYNSNVLMYDRQTKSLWSQLGLIGVSGPHAGRTLEHLPVRVVSFERFGQTHPKGWVVSRDTGHERPYEGAGYAGYFATDDLLVDVQGVSQLRDDLPRKTLGLGVLHDGAAWFITADALDDGYTLHTPAGPVIARRTGSGDQTGVEVLALAEGVVTSQTFYYAWASFFPETEVVLE